jgi:thiamine-triphosphatase
VLYVRDGAERIADSFLMFVSWIRPHSIIFSFYLLPWLLMKPTLRLGALLEVERKFCSLAVKDLVSDVGQPPFKSICSLSQEKIHDVYYDTSSKSLINSGIYVRKRNGLWEAKLRRGGDFTNSMFEELSGSELVRQWVWNVTGKEVSEEECFGLEAIASFSTVRQAWSADNDFKIVLDSMDFGHTVGEVELQEDFHSSASTNASKELEMREKMTELDERIGAFMNKYHWAFHLGVPKGKLMAYFELKEAGKIS